MANTYTDLLKLRMPALGDIGWDDEVNDNTEIFEFTVAPVLKGNRIVSGLAPSDGGGLDIDTAAGTVVVDGAVYTLSSDTNTCTASSKNYLFVDDTGALNVTTTMPTGSFTAIAVIDTDITSILRFSDARAMAQGALAMAIDYTPEHYTPDTSQDAPIDQHLAALDAMLYEEPRLNLFLNGDFQVAQRATSQTASGQHSIDTFRFTHTIGSATTTQETFTLGQTDVPGKPKNYVKKIVTTGGTAASYSMIIKQVLNVRTLAGITSVLSFYAKADAVKNIAIEGAQIFGSGGSSSIDSIGVTTVSLSTVWQLFVFLFNFPSISGKTLGSTPDYSQFNFWLEGGSDYDSRTNSLGNQSGTFEFADMQLLPGSDAKAFQRKSFEDALLDCLPYFCQNGSSFGDCVFYNGYIITSETYRVRKSFPLPMIIAPQVTLVNQDAAGFAASAGTTNGIDKHGFQEERVATATSNSGYFSTNWKADTGY